MLRRLSLSLVDDRLPPDGPFPGPYGRVVMCEPAVGFIFYFSLCLREVAVLESEGQVLRNDVPGLAGGVVWAEIVGTSWRKSSRSTYNGNCVEVGELRDGRVGIRDTKDQEKGPVLIFPRSHWNAFLADVVRGSFDFH
jgi:Domain of unknown function (DUF397)